VNSSGATAKHRIAGLLSLVALLGVAAAVPSWGGLREPARVEAARTFRIHAPTPDRYEWTLTDGVVPGGQLISQRVLTLERGELAEVSLAEVAVASLGLTPSPEGGEVEAGQLLANLRMPRAERSLAELRAERSVLQAQRDLLLAGGRDEDVQQAQQVLAVAQARRARAQVDADRLAKLSNSGAIAAADMQDASLKATERDREVDQAYAALNAARAPARPEAVSGVDARLGVVDAGIEELEARLADARIKSPITGVVDRAGDASGVLMTVYELDPVYLHMPVSTEHFHRLQAGDAVRFQSNAGGTFEGEIVALGPGATTLSGAPVVWVSARVANPQGKLRPGMTGEAQIAPGAPGAWGLLDAIREAMSGS